MGGPSSSGGLEQSHLVSLQRLWRIKEVGPGLLNTPVFSIPLKASLRLWGFPQRAEDITTAASKGQGIKAWPGELTETPYYGFEIFGLRCLWCGCYLFNLSPLCARMYPERMSPSFRQAPPPRLLHEEISPVLWYLSKPPASCKLSFYF